MATKTLLDDSLAATRSEVASSEHATSVTTEASAPEEGLYPGSVVSEKYRLVAHLGSGGMATVFSAEHLGLGTLYALKFVRSDLSLRPQSLRRFEREAQVLAKVSHENIVALLDIGSGFKATPYLVLEFIRGQTLRREFEAGPMPLLRLVETLVQVSRGLGAAHAAGVIHRDLKPENIMLSQHADGRLLAKLLDFGVAGLYETELETLTATGHAPGTAAYMSPEQARGDSHIDARSDVYALGVIAYEGTAGKRPYTGRSYNEILFAISHRSAAPLADHRPDLPAAFCAAVDRALAREPNQRFESPWDFACTLRDALGEFGTETGSTEYSGISQAVSSSRTQRSGAISSSSLESRDRGLALWSALGGILGGVLISAAFKAWPGPTDPSQQQDPPGVMLPITVSPDPAALPNESRPATVSVPRASAAREAPNPSFLSSRPAAPSSESSVQSPDPIQNAKTAGRARDRLRKEGLDRSIEQPAAAPLPAPSTTASSRPTPRLSGDYPDSPYAGSAATR